MFTHFENTLKAGWSELARSPKANGAQTFSGYASTVGQDSSAHKAIQFDHNGQSEALFSISDEVIELELAIDGNDVVLRGRAPSGEQPAVTGFIASTE